MNLFNLGSIVLLLSTSIFAQEKTDSLVNHTNPHVFAGYELGEMVFNRFRNFGGEVGIVRSNDHRIRFVYLNVDLTEDHLASEFTLDVDGENVKGTMVGYEMFYDFPLLRLKKHNGILYGGVSAGYYENGYSHTINGTSISHSTPTIGGAISYRENDLFTVKGLYYNLSIPVRFYFNPLEKQMPGETTVNRHLVVNNIWFTVGYEFGRRDS